MKNKPLKTIAILCFLSIMIIENTFACSMYKLTKNGHTMIGCNEDAWRLSSKIWFENSSTDKKYGTAFTGSRLDGADGYAPQSGMNEVGLCFSRLASHTPEKQSNKNLGTKKIEHPTLYLKDILHNCKTVDEVEAYINQYDHSFFLEDVFIYIEASGKYLIVEPFSMMSDTQSKYVLSNFCPSVTSETKAQKLTRYHNGVEFLKNKLDTSLSFCTALSDTMHVCREKIGDGTLLTSIWDLQNGIVHLYFYHDYKHVIAFNIHEELKKGDHILAIPKLFPENAEFKKLASYKTPQNYLPIMIFLIITGLIFLLSSLLFLLNYSKYRKQSKYSIVSLIMAPLSLLMFYYLIILCRNINIFYFAAPYKDSSSMMISMTSYIPYLIAIIIIPLSFFVIKTWQEKQWSLIARLILTYNLLSYLVLIAFFIYWRFY